ncbi:hypothetical protein ES708_28560 [subsurface metagenome]
MKNYISAKEFANYWTDFIKEKILSDSNWREWYDHEYKTWTEKTIGLPVSEEENSPFGDFIKSKTGLRYRKEDGLVDLTFAPDNNFENILSLHEKPEDRFDVLKKDPEKVPFYPRHYSILVEHENDIYKCYEEMAKLAYCRARLKVLITYNENVDLKDDYMYLEEVIVQNFTKIKKQSNENFPENKNTEYLLLVGQKRKDTLTWNSKAI